MNRILFEPTELKDAVATFGGERAAHVLGVLHGEIGQTLKTGVIDGPIGTSTITAIADGEITVRCTHDAEAPGPWFDLILAPPRPRVMKRLLPQLASLGVGTIVLVGAKKVEKDFWGATLLKEANYRPLLVDGLMQAGTTALPKLLLRRNFRAFLRDELETLFPTANRVVAHPDPEGGFADGRAGRLLLAVGPEGGWTDDEVALLASLGFARCSLGGRILRTDTAVIALAAKLNKENR